VRERVLGRPIVRVKVWSPDGRIVYSDAATLIGRRFPLPEDLREALADDAVRADVSDLSLPENRFERGRGRLVEVYLPLRIADGRRVIVETYHPAGSIAAASGRIWRTILPVPVALLIALAAAQLPLGWYHTRRSRAEAAERERQAEAARKAAAAKKEAAEAAAQKGFGNPSIKAQVYGKKSDPWTGRAITVLERNKVDFDFVDLEEPEHEGKLGRALIETKQHTVPFIYLRGQFVGGFNALSEIERLGQLEVALMTAEERAKAPPHLQKLTITPRPNTDEVAPAEQDPTA